MARPPKISEPRQATLRPEDMRAALPRLAKRIAELRAATLTDIGDQGDPKLSALEQKINSTLSDIFGSDTIEYKNFGDMRLDQTPFNLYGVSVGQMREGFAHGIQAAISSLEAIV